MDNRESKGDNDDIDVAVELLYNELVIENFLGADQITLPHRFYLSPSPKKTAAEHFGADARVLSGPGRREDAYNHNSGLRDTC